MVKDSIPLLHGRKGPENLEPHKAFVQCRDASQSIAQHIDFMLVRSHEFLPVVEVVEMRLSIPASIITVEVMAVRPMSLREACIEPQTEANRSVAGLMSLKYTPSRRDRGGRVIRWLSFSS